MAEQKCDIYEAKRILGITRGKTCAAITKEEKGEGSRQNQRRREERNKAGVGAVEETLIESRTQPGTKY